MSSACAFALHRFPKGSSGTKAHIPACCWGNSTEMLCSETYQHVAAVQHDRYAMQKAHEQKSIANQVQKTQSGYMRNQKKTHKRILGKGSNHSLGAVRACDAKELHTVPNKVTETVRKFYQRLVDPATPAGKTGAFLPNEALRQYPWRHGRQKPKMSMTLERKGYTFRH